MARFFEGSLEELMKRHANLQTALQRSNSQKFTATIYQNGKSVARCGIGLGGWRGFDGGITFSHDDSAEQALFLRPLGMGGEERSHLSFDGAAEYYWEMLMAPLQR